MNSSSGIAIGYTMDKHYETCNFNTKNTTHKTNTVGMIPCCLLLMTDKWNCKDEEVVTYLNSVNKGNKTES
jgi:hypothetical protein